MNEDQKPAPEKIFGNPSRSPNRSPRGNQKRKPPNGLSEEEYSRILMEAAAALGGLPVLEDPGLQKQQDDFDESNS